MTQDTCKKIEQILQFSAVVWCVNQYDEFLFFNCKSGDITGWGLKRITTFAGRWIQGNLFFWTNATLLLFQNDNYINW